MLFNDLKYGKNSLFCCNSNAIFTIFFYESQAEQLRKAFTKEKKGGKSVKNFFIAVLLLFYDLK